MNAPSDVWILISSFLRSNIDKGRLMLINKQLSKCKIYFYEEINLRKIMYSQWFDQFLNISVQSNVMKLPAAVQRLYFSKKYDEPINFMIPNTVKLLIFGRRFNQSIMGHIPNSVTELTFGRFFNQNIGGALPDSIKKLTFGNHFNKSVSGNIPISVKKLRFGTNFNRPIIELPSSIKELIFGKRFSQSIRGHIPTSVRKLELGEFFYSSIRDKIPFSVTHLKVSYGYNIMSGIPESVTHLFVENIYKNNPPIQTLIPSTVTHLFLCWYHQAIENLQELNVIELTFKLPEYYQNTYADKIIKCLKEKNIVVNFRYGLNL